MTELIRILYDYAYDRYMQAYLDDATQYHECDAASSSQYRNLQEHLSPELQQRLEDYRDDLKLMYRLELEAMFRAGLTLGQRLSRL